MSRFPPYSIGGLGRDRVLGGRSCRNNRRLKGAEIMLQYLSVLIDAPKRSIKQKIVIRSLSVVNKLSTMTWELKQERGVVREYE
jgi:hypothetical protein